MVRLIAGNMPELTEIDSTKKVTFEDPKKDAADSDSDSSLADAGASKGGEGASGVTAEDLSNKARQSRGEKKARKIISKLGLKQVKVRAPFLKKVIVDRRSHTCL